MRKSVGEPKKIVKSVRLATIEITRSSNIAHSLTKGNNKLFLRTSQDTSSYGDTNNGHLYSTDACSKTGLIKMVVDVIGYMNYE